MKGQLSAEMLILIAVIVAVVAIAATRLITTAKTSSEQVGNDSKRLLDSSEYAMKNLAGEPCPNGPEDCQSNNCASGKCQ